MSEDRASREAVDRLTRRIVDHAKQTGRPVSEDTARREAMKTAKDTDARKGW